MVLKLSTMYRRKQSVWEWCRNVWCSSFWNFSDTRKQFENDVEMYGAQAGQMQEYIHELFENDVEMYGAQAMHLLKEIK